MKYKKIIPIFLFLMIIFTPILAQEASIKIEQSGFGETGREAHFTIYNTGDVPITDVTFYVDGKQSKIIKGLSNPGDGFHAILFLEPGDHFIEVKTPEEAYDTINVTIPKAKEMFYGMEESSILKEYSILIGILVIIGVIVVVLWILRKKPRLKLK